MARRTSNGGFCPAHSVGRSGTSLASSPFFRATFPQRTITADGIEATLAVDVVGPFLLTALLRERLEAARGRVVALTGIYQRKGHVDANDLHFTHRPYDWLAANNQAQKCRWLFTSELARRAPRLLTSSIHPGAVLTARRLACPGWCAH